MSGREAGAAGAPASDAAHDARPGPRVGELLVDARALHDSGIGRYLRGLLAEWLAAPPFARLTLLGEPEALRAFVAAHPSDAQVRVRRHAGGFYSAAAQLSWLRAGARASGASDAVTFFPHWDAPVVGLPRRAVVTVHDLTQFRVPDAFGAARRAAGARVLRLVASRARRIVTVSHATARDLVAELPHVADRVRVVPNGVDPAPATVGPAPVAGPYLLCVGNQKPHKNLVRAVDTLAGLRSGRPALRLVLAGRRYAGADAVRARAAELALPDAAIVDLGEVDDGTLWALYRDAAVLLFPSRYEGFGLPALEAMRAGTPVVASDTPGLAETVGDAALCVAPDDAEGWVSATAALLDDGERRRVLVARARERAAAFSWATAARRTAAVLREAADAGHGSAAVPTTASAG